MYAKEAIKKADELRPNTLSEQQKYDMLNELDGKVAEVTGDLVERPSFPQDFECLMPFPYDNIYPLYLVAMIDYYNQETGLYANDMQMFNAAWEEALAWWRRENRAKYKGNWRIM